MKDENEGFGDDQGTRVGRPTPETPRGEGSAASDSAPVGHRADRKTTTGAGAEAAEGIHAADGDREPADRTALEGKRTGRDDDAGTTRSGSEPQSSHDHEHHSRYGGDAGKPKNY